MKYFANHRLHMWKNQAFSDPVGPNQGKNARLKLRCDSRFQRAFTACNCVFKVIILV